MQSEDEALPEAPMLELDDASLEAEQFCLLLLHQPSKQVFGLNLLSSRSSGNVLGTYSAISRHGNVLA